MGESVKWVYHPEMEIQGTVFPECWMVRAELDDGWVWMQQYTVEVYEDPRCREVAERRAMEHAHLRHPPREVLNESRLRPGETSG